MSSTLLNRTDTTNWPKADEEAAYVVELILEANPDRSMTDEEIAEDSINHVLEMSPGRLRHGRLFLERTGRIYLAGLGRTTSGRTARKWRLKNEG